MMQRSSRSFFYWFLKCLETRRRFRLNATLSLSVALISISGLALAQVTIPDAQVEASVLKALAGAKDIESQSISTRTVYGVVTLSGTVRTEAQRVEAENLAANANGVKKVIDELQVASPPGHAPLQAEAQSMTPARGMVLQSDGTYAPATNEDLSSGATPSVAQPSGAEMPDSDRDQAQYRRQANGSTTDRQPSGQSSSTPAPYGQATSTPLYEPRGSGSQPQGKSSPQGQTAAQPEDRYPGYSQNQTWGGQVAGESVVIPSGALVRVRVDRFLASDKLKAGDFFEGFAANDVVAGGSVAIPRGAAVQGKVIDARSSGAISGRGELSVQLTSVTLGGRTYPLFSDTWSRSGPDKTGQTVTNVAGLGITGALIGAIIGRGAGAAIGAGVGAAAGVGASAASSRGQVVIPPEGMLTFHLAEPAQVITVSEQEMQRLAYSIPPGERPPPRQPLYVRPYPVYGYPPMPPYGYPAY